MSAIPPNVSVRPMDEVVKMLKVPLPAAAIAQHPTKPYLSTIKAIYVVERFNEVFGLGGWKVMSSVEENRESSKMVVVHSIFYADAWGIRVEAFGGNDNADRGDAYKGACTDALTKIGSYLYVGMDVYKGLGSTEDKPPAKPPVSLKPLTANTPAKGTTAMAPATEEQMGTIKKMITDLGGLTDSGKAGIRKKIGAPATGDLTRVQADAYIKELSIMVDVPLDLPVVPQDP